jgi:hypothetical protein
MTRDDILTNPEVTRLVEDEAKRVARALRLDNVDAKEVYRSMLEASVQVALIANG